MIHRPLARVLAAGERPTVRPQDRQLGCTISYHDETYAFVHRDQLTIHLRAAPDGNLGGGEPQDFEYGKTRGLAH